MKWEGVTVLVTGAGGFIGSHLTRRLVAEGAQVHAWVRPSSEPRRLSELQTSLKIHPVPIEDRDSVVRECLRIRPTVCFHLAAYGLGVDRGDGTAAVQTNVLGTANLLGALDQSGCRRFVYATTSFEYASKASAISEEDPLRPQGVYAETKAAGSLMVQAWARHSGLPWVVARLFGVYGPYEDSHKVIPYTISTLLQGNTAEVSAGEVVRDYLYVEDAVEGLLNAATLTGPTTVNLGSGQPIRLREILAEIERRIGGRIHFGARPARPGEPESLWADTGRARTLMGWKPTVSLEEGLTKTIAWHRIQEEETTKAPTRQGQGASRV